MPHRTPNRPAEPVRTTTQAESTRHSRCRKDAGRAEEWDMREGKDVEVMSLLMKHE